MASERIAQLVSALYERTVDGKAEWAPDSHNDSYKIRFPTFKVRVSKADGKHPYTAKIENGIVHALQILDADGQVVEQVTSLEENLSELLPFLYEEARRCCSRVDLAIDEIMAALA